MFPYSSTSPRAHPPPRGSREPAARTAGVGRAKLPVTLDTGLGRWTTSAFPARPRPRLLPATLVTVLVLASAARTFVTTSVVSGSLTARAPGSRSRRRDL